MKVSHTMVGFLAGFFTTCAILSIISQTWAYLGTGLAAGLFLTVFAKEASQQAIKTARKAKRKTPSNQLNQLLHGLLALKQKVKRNE